MGISKAIYTTSLTIIKSILKSRTEDDIEKDLIDHFAGIISDSSTVDAISNKISDIVKTYRKNSLPPSDSTIASDAISRFSQEQIEPLIFLHYREGRDRFAKALWDISIVWLNKNYSDSEMNETAVQDCFLTAARLLFDIVTSSDEFHQEVAMRTYENTSQLMQSVNQLQQSVPQTGDTAPSPITDTDATPCFEFEISPEGQLKPLSLATKNSMRKWFINKFCLPKVTVKVIESSKCIAQEELDMLDRKVENGGNLTIQEEHRFNDLSANVEHFTTYEKIKAIACSYFFNDHEMHSFLGFKTYLDLLPHLEGILSDYHHKLIFRLMNDRNYTTLDFSIDPSPYCHDYFLGFIETERLSEALGESYFPTTYLFHTNDYVIEMTREAIASQLRFYYLFLAEEIIKFGFTDIEKEPRVMNFLNFRVGLH